MNETNNIEKRRKFLQLTAIGSMSAFFVGLLPFSTTKAIAVPKPENTSILVKTHPQAVKRNKKG